MIIAILTFLGTFLTHFESDHAIYLSTIHIQLEEHRVSVEINVFEDDLRDALRNEFDIVVDTSSQDFARYVRAYFNNHLSLYLNDSKFSYTQFEVSRESEIYKISAGADIKSLVQKISIDADYFMEIFPLQQNVLNLRIGVKRRYHIFKKGKTKFDFRINS